MIYNRNYTNVIKKDKTEKTIIENISEIKSFSPIIYNIRLSI